MGMDDKERVLLSESQLLVLSVLLFTLYQNSASDLRCWKVNESSYVFFYMVNKCVFKIILLCSIIS